MTRYLSCLVLYSFAVIVVTGCNSADESSSPQSAAEVTDQSAESRFAFPVQNDVFAGFEYRNGREAGRYSIVESLGGGAAVVDLDGDQQAEVFLTGGGTFAEDDRINGRDGRVFRVDSSGRFLDVTAVSGFDISRLYSHGLAAADYNSDGFIDLVVTGYGKPLLFENNGDGTLTVVASDVLPQTQWTSSAGWGDVNEDGFADLYLCQYVNWSFENDPPCPGFGSPRDVCPPRSFEGLTDVLCINDGSGSFTAGGPEAGLQDGGKGLGVLIADVDNDSDLDIYVANDTTENFLYLNDGSGHLTEEGLVRGVALDNVGAPNGSMGLSLLDFDSSGEPDLWVTNFEDEQFALYRNLGFADFVHVSRDAGIAGMGDSYVGFGTVACDFDCDGDEDLAVANGHVVYYPKEDNELQVPVLLENMGGRFVRSEQATGYFAAPQAGRGLAAGDLNGDGRPDLVAVPCNMPAVAAINDSSPTGRWLRLRVIGTAVDRNAVGTQLQMKTTSGTQYRQVTGGGSYASQSEPVVFFGVPAEDDIRQLTIIWPNGSQQDLTSLSVNTTTTVIQGRDRVFTDTSN